MHPVKCKTKYHPLLTDLSLDHFEQGIASFSGERGVGEGQGGGGEELLHLHEVLFEVVAAEFIALGSDDLDGDAGFFQPVEGFEVDGESRVPKVEQQTDHDEAGGLLHIFVNEGGPAVFVFLAGLCEAVAGEVYEVPVLSLFFFVLYAPRLDGVVVDGACLAGFAANVGELLPSGEGIDERGFAYVRTADEGDLFLAVCHVLGTVHRRGKVGGGKYMKFGDVFDLCHRTAPFYGSTDPAMESASL